MSEVDRLSNSGLYPALPIADKRPSRDNSGGPAPGGKQAPDKPAPQAGNAAEPAALRPPKSLIDEYASMSMTMNMELFLSIAGVALGFLGVLAALCAQRAVRGWRARCLSVESRLAALRRELELAASISVKSGRRVKRNEQECSAVADRVAQLELRGAAQSFDQAIDSARRGTDPGKLALQFGLSSGEADLVSRLHGRKKIA